VTLTANGIEIEDMVTGTGEHEIKARFYLNGAEVRAPSSREVEAGNALLTFDHDISIEPAQIARRFGELADAVCVMVATSGSLPISLITGVTFSRTGQAH
jgi:hypothetical protein